MFYRKLNDTTELRLLEPAHADAAFALVKAVLAYAFDELKLHRMELCCAPENRRSRAIAERLGFKQEGILREEELVGGRYLDTVMYAMLADEWRAGNRQG